MSIAIKVQTYKLLRLYRPMNDPSSSSLSLLFSKFLQGNCYIVKLSHNNIVLLLCCYIITVTLVHGHIITLLLYYTLKTAKGF